MAVEVAAGHGVDDTSCYLSGSIKRGRGRGGEAEEKVEEREWRRRGYSYTNHTTNVLQEAHGSGGCRYTLLGHTAL